MTSDSKPRIVARNLALDRARTFITLVVLVHHSVIAYTYFGNALDQTWLGLDAIALFNDSFFMAAMFLVSGLFVWPSLQRKGVGWFLRDRWWRLGFPFLIAALFLMPLAYYAIALRSHTGDSFGAFWWKTVTIGPWESGPAWFVWVLLIFDIMAAALYKVAPGAMNGLAGLSRMGFARPGLVLAIFIVASAIAYIPMVLYVGPTRWFVVGPLAVQGSRILLYPLYFFVGVGIGAVAFEQGLLASRGALAKRWPVWLLATVLSYGGIIALVIVKRIALGDPPVQPMVYQTIYALMLVTFSAAQTLNLLALFVRFGGGGRNVLDRFRDTAYGIYLIHYVPVLWLQYALLGLVLTPVPQMSAVLKAVIVFAVALATSWAAAALLRKIPGAKRVL